MDDMYEDFSPEEENVDEELDIGERKMSIRALNFKMMSRLP
jgi:hypothetical protein